VRECFVVPFSFDDLLEEFDAVAEEIGEAWPKDVSAVGAVREERAVRNVACMHAFVTRAKYFWETMVSGKNL